MLRSPTVTARVSGRSRAPPHARHGISRMNCSSFSRWLSESVSTCRRSTFGTTPSYVVQYERVPPVPVLVLDVDLLVRAVQERRRGPSSGASSTGSSSREAVRRRPRPRGPGSSTRAVALAHGASAPSRDRTGRGRGRRARRRPRAASPRPSQVVARAVRGVEREVPRLRARRTRARERARERLARRSGRSSCPRASHRDRRDPLRQLAGPSRSSRRPAGGCPAWRRAGRRRPRSCACRSSGQPDRLGELADLAVDPGPREPLAREVLRGASRTPPCDPGRPARAPGTACPRAARITWSTICSGVWRPIGRPHLGQCGCPTRAYSTRR